jgi:hypothetical protein
LSTIYQEVRRNTTGTINPATGITGFGEAVLGNGDKAAGITVNVQATDNGGGLGGNVYVEIYAATGTPGAGALPTGAPIATSNTIDASLLPQFSPGDVAFTFASPPVLTSGSAYVFLLIWLDPFASGSIIDVTATSATHAGANGVYGTDAAWAVNVNNLTGTFTGQSRITAQPQDAGRQAGSTASFSVSATAFSGALSYQWQRAEPDTETFVNVGGATSSTYTTGALGIDADDGARYRCLVTDATGTSTSSAASLAVGAAGRAIIIRVGGAPISLEQTWAAAAAARTWALHIGGAPVVLDQSFQAVPAQTAWSWLLGLGYLPASAFSIFSYTATGGLVTAGSAAWAIAYAPPAGGSETTGGGAAVSVTYAYATSGGLTTGGGAAEAFVDAYATSGEVDTGGAAATEFVPSGGGAVFAYDGTGGLVTDGAAAVEFVKKQLSGRRKRGVTLIPNQPEPAVLERRVFTFVGASERAITLRRAAAAAEVSVTKAYAGAGSVRLAGSASVAASYAPAVTGPSLVVAGAARTMTRALFRVVPRAGGVSTGGAARVEVSYWRERDFTEDEIVAALMRLAA